MPAMNCAAPPYGIARASTTGMAPTATHPALITDSTSVVMANAASPNGAGSPTSGTSTADDGPTIVGTVAELTGVPVMLRSGTVPLGAGLPGTVAMFPTQPPS